MTISEILDSINHILGETNYVVVGSVAISRLNTGVTPTDIDIVCYTPVGLSSLGSVNSFYTDFVGSLSGNRAIIERPDYNIDIFIETSLPAAVDYGGYPYATYDAIYDHTTYVINNTTDLVIKGKYQYQLSLITP